MDLWGEESGGRHRDRGGVGKVDEKGEIIKEKEGWDVKEKIGIGEGRTTG